MGKRPPIPPELLSSDTDRFYELLNNAPDVSLVVVASGYIDACLASLLAKHLRVGATTEQLLDSRTGAIGSFAARAALAYGLALVSKELYHDLQVFAELRNEVAHHHFELRLTEPSVAAHCMSLKYILSLRDASTGHPIFDPPMVSAPRERFTMSAMMVASRLLLTALAEKHAGE
jgi:DNA-binding MltR family transcriptional regulator